MTNAPLNCPALGVPLDYGRKADGKASPYSPSVDRIVPELGYTPDNCIIVSAKANTVKSYASPEEVLKVGKFYTQLQHGSTDKETK